MFQGDSSEFHPASGEVTETPTYNFEQFLADVEQGGQGFSGKSEIEKLESLIQIAEQYAKDQLNDPEAKLQSDPRWDEMSKAVKKLYRMQGKEWHPESRNLIVQMLDISTHYSPGEAVLRSVKKGWQLGGRIKKSEVEKRDDGSREEQIVQFMKGIEQAKAQLAQMKRAEQVGEKVETPTQVETFQPAEEERREENSDLVESAGRKGVFESRKKTLEWLFSEKKKEIGSLIEKVAEGSLTEEDVAKTFEEDEVPEELLKIIFTSLGELHATGLSELPPVKDKLKLILESKLYPTRKSVTKPPHEGFKPEPEGLLLEERRMRARVREWILLNKSDTIDELIETVIDGNPQDLDVRAAFRDAPEIEDLYIGAITRSLVELRRDYKDARNPRQIFEGLLLKNLEPDDISVDTNNQK